MDESKAMTSIIWKGESDSSVDDIVIERAQLGGAAIENVDFVNCTFIGCNFLEAKLAKVTFTRCSFKGCDFAMCSFTQCEFWEAQFDDCKLIGINWSIAGLAIDAQFLNCRLDYSSFFKLSLRSKKIEKCSAIECNFSHCDLRKSHFMECDLSNSSFTGSDVRNADFSTSIGVFINPENTKVGKTAIGSDAAARLAMSHGFTVPSIFTD